MDGGTVMCNQNDNDRQTAMMFSGGVAAAMLGVAAAGLADALDAAAGAMIFTGIVAALATFVPCVLMWAWFTDRVG